MEKDFSLASKEFHVIDIIIFQKKNQVGRKLYILFHTYVRHQHFQREQKFDGS